MPNVYSDQRPEKHPEDTQSEPALKRMNGPARLFRWLDKRTGVHDIMNESLDEPIPGGARLAYVFGSGLLYIFISQIITGICLALYYVPSAETAHTSVAYITKQVAAGAFLRSLHYYGSSAMVIVLALHFLQTFLYGSFKGRRELLWISGAVLSLLVLGMGFTGYLLPWDQKAYFATAVGTNIVGEIPLIGNWLTRLLRGGDTIGTLTLSRFYVAHVFLIPAMIFGFIATHILLFRKAGPAGPINEDPITPKLAPEGFYPRQVLMDMTFALLIMVGLGFLAYFHPAGLGPVANPADTQFLPRPDWYYLPFFEWLKFWEGPKVVFAVVVIPGILALLFFLLPFLDRSLERRPWRRPIPVLSVAIVLAGLLFLGIKSHMDDVRDPSVRTQLATQDQQETAYGKIPFAPYQESPGGSAPAVAAGPANPLIAHGRSLFETHGCAGCHGAAGAGGIAPALVGVAAKLPGQQLTNLLLHPNAAMIAGHMPAVDLSAPEMTAMVAYLGALGTHMASAPAGPPATTATGPTIVSGKSATPPSGSTAAASGDVNDAAGKPTSGAAAGQKIFEERGCVACHGPAGSGGRAPAMSTVIAGQSPAHILQLLQAPDAKMKAGGMAPVAGTPEELRSLVDYMRTLHAPQSGGQSSAKSSVVNASISPANTAAPNAPVAANPSVRGEKTPAPASNQPAAPQATQASAATAPAKANPGRAIFVTQGCAACHGSIGQGTHFAPTLVGIGGKYPGDKLPTLLQHPDSKMRAGGMPPVTINPAQMKQLVSYLSSLSITPTVPNSNSSVAAAPVPSSQAAAGAKQTAPAQLAVAAPLSPLALQGGKVYQRNACQTCHGVGGLRGTVAAPELAGTASILPAPMLENLLRHHTVKMQEGGMPLTNMNAQDMKALVAYIRSMPSTSDTQ